MHFHCFLTASDKDVVTWAVPTSLVTSPSNSSAYLVFDPLSFTVPSGVINVFNFCKIPAAALKLSTEWPLLWHIYKIVNCHRGWQPVAVTLLIIGLRTNIIHYAFFWHQINFKIAREEYQEGGTAGRKPMLTSVFGGSRATPLTLLSSFMKYTLTMLY